jgi:hypothetical protein
VTRRAALRKGGGATLAALLAAVLGGRSLAAQDAGTPPSAGEGLEGLFVEVRLRKLKEGVSPDEVIAIGNEEVLPIIRAIPGFVLYFGSINPVTGDGLFAGVFEDQAGAAESTRRVAEWLTEKGYDFWEGDPIVAGAAIDYAAEADETAA